LAVHCAFGRNTRNVEIKSPHGKIKESKSALLDRFEIEGTALYRIREVVGPLLPTRLRACLVSEP
jgi:hypothetical protein